MAKIHIDSELLNQISGSLKTLAVDLAAHTTWEDVISEQVEKVWAVGTPPFVHDAVQDMIDDWDYARSILALQAENAAKYADGIGQKFDDWDASIGKPGVTRLETGDFENAGGDA